jgi:hypothetical protein
VSDNKKLSSEEVRKINELAKKKSLDTKQAEKRNEEMKKILGR